MRIVDLDYDQRIEKLKKDIKNVKNVKNALAESRREFRAFSESIGLDFDALDSCFTNFEKTVLIDAYTLAEQLVKNSYYFLLDIDIENEYVKNFIGSKIPKEKFSPNVRYGELLKNMKSDLIPDFSFLIKQDNDYIKSYDILISERHRYAHTGNYQFEFSKIDEVVSAIEYLYKEFEIILQHDSNYRKQFQEKLMELIDNVKRIQSVVIHYNPSSEGSVSAVTNKCILLQNDINSFYGQYSDEMSFSIFSDLNQMALEYSALDIVSDVALAIEKYNSLLDELTELKLA